MINLTLKNVWSWRFKSKLHSRLYMFLFLNKQVHLYIEHLGLFKSFHVSWIVIFMQFLLIIWVAETKKIFDWFNKLWNWRMSSLMSSLAVLICWASEYHQVVMKCVSIWILVLNLLGLQAFISVAKVTIISFLVMIIRCLCILNLFIFRFRKLVPFENVDHFILWLSFNIFLIVTHFVEARLT